MKNKEIFNKLLRLKKKDLIHRKFSFSQLNYGELATVDNIPNCGTTGCLAGELPRFTTEFFFDIEGDLDNEDGSPLDLALSEFFGLPNRYTDAIFFPIQQNYVGLCDISGDASFTKVIDNAKKVKKLLIEKGLY